MSAGPWIQGIGWALVHSLWQGALIAAAVRLLAGTRTDDPRRRHRVAAAGLALMLAATAATAVREAHRAAEGMGVPAWAQAAIQTPEPAAEREAAPSVPAAGAQAVDPRAERPSSRIEAIRRVLEPAMPALVAAWACGVLLLGVRLGRGWRATRRVRTRGVLALPADWEARVGRLATRMRLSRPVRALQSAAADVPMVIGALKPVLLVPASLLTGMPAAQLELLIAHEMAHVRRHDYLVNLLQSAAEVLLFYHPAAWWLSGTLRDAREQCCDDEVVRATGRPRAYVAALVALEGLRPAAPLAAAATDGTLLRRARRLLGADPWPRGRRDGFATSAAGLAGLAAVVVAMVLLDGSARPASAGVPASPPSRDGATGGASTVAATRRAEGQGDSGSGASASTAEERHEADPAATLETRLRAVPDGAVWMTFATRPGACGTADLLVLRAADRNVAVRGGRMDAGYSRRAADNWNAVPSCAQGLLRVRLEMADGRVRSLSSAIVDAAEDGEVDAGGAVAHLLSLAASAPEPVALQAMTAAVLAAAPAPSSALLSIAQDAGRPDAVRAFAARWLGHVGDASVASALERLARGASTPHAVRLASVDALGALSGGLGSPHLARLRNDAPNDRVRQAAIQQWDLLQARLPAPDT